MDRNDFYFKQRVTQAEMDEAFDGAEQAIWDLAKDQGIFGALQNGVVTQHSPLNLTVDISGSFIGYSQNGERLVFGPAQNLDLTSYLPTTPGNSKWVVVYVKFARDLQDPRIDGNGATVYWQRLEDFEIAVVDGVEATSGTEVKPAKPSDGVTLADVNLDQGQTQIINADIDTARRDDFVIASAAQTSVSAGSWTKLSTGSATVQDAFDDIDAKIIPLDGSGFVSEKIVPDTAVSYDLGETGAEWDDVWVDQLHVVTDAAYKAAKTQHRVYPIWHGLNEEDASWVFRLNTNLNSEIQDAWYAEHAAGGVEWFVYFPLFIPHNGTLEEIKLEVYQDATADAELQAAIRQKDYAGGDDAGVAGATTTLASFGTWQELTVTPASPIAVDADPSVGDGYVYCLRVRAGWNTTTGTVISAVRSIRVETTITNISDALI